MKRIFILACIFIMPPIFALPQPAYLNIPAWKNCTSTMVRGDAVFVCLPKDPPWNCPSASWKLLQNQNLIERCIKP